MIRPFPKPPTVLVPRLKPERLPVRKRMTLIAGFRCAEGILVCADREEATANSKRSVGKIKAIPLATAQIVMAGAGRSSILENAFERFRARFAEIENDPDLPVRYSSEIQTVIKSVYKDFIWGYPDEADREVGFVFAVRFHSGEMHLHSTDQDIPNPHVTYGCLGIGSDLAYYFADRIYQQSLNRAEMMLLATFIFREVGESVRDVHGTEMIMLHGTGRIIHVEPGVIKEMEAALPEFGDALGKFWKDKARIPNLDQNGARILKCCDPYEHNERMTPRHSSLLLVQFTMPTKFAIVPSRIWRLIFEIRISPMVCFEPRDTLVLDMSFPF